MPSLPLPRPGRHFLAAGLLAATLPLAAPAVELTWDGDPLVAGITNVGAAIDAPDVWLAADGVTNTSFVDGSDLAFIADGTDAFVVAKGTTNLGPYTVGNLTISTTSTATSNGVQLATFPVQYDMVLNGTAHILPGSTGLVVLYPVFSGPGSVIVDGGELRLLNNLNTFSGGVTLNAGILRVGNGNGVGAPQTIGSLGIGTFTINGGVIHQSQGNARIQAVAAVVNADFQFTSSAGGGLSLGTTDGSRPVDLGNATRTITVGQAADGTGASSLFGLRSLRGTVPAGATAIVKRGAGVLEVQGSNPADFVGDMVVEAGELRVSGASGSLGTPELLGTTSFTVQAGALMRGNTNNNLLDPTTIRLLGGNLAMRDSGGNARRDTIATLLVSGGVRIDVGGGLALAPGAAGLSGSFQVRAGGLLGGEGAIQSGLSAQASGVTTFTDLVDAAVVLYTDGVIAPGAPASVDTTIGSLTLGSLTWNGGATAQIRSNLAAGGLADRIVLTTGLVRGTGTSFVFDCLGSAPGPGTYTLLEAAAIDPLFTTTDFTYTNLVLGTGETAELQVNGGLVQIVITGSLSLFEQWIASFGLTGDDTGDAVDLDGNLLGNLLEYALDGHPVDPTDNPAPVEALDGDLLTLTFERIGDPDLVYEVWATGDLLDWGAAPIWTSTGADNVPGLVTVDDVAASLPGAPRFMSLVVLRP